jgi:hypothetical protein
VEVVLETIKKKCQEQLNWFTETLEENLVCLKKSPKGTEGLKCYPYKHKPYECSTRDHKESGPEGCLGRKLLVTLKLLINELDYAFELLVKYTKN